MCRNIRPLYNFEPPATEQEIDAAALQFVRKVSGMQRPSNRNQAAFDDAVRQVAATTARLMQELVTTAAPRDRETERARQQARNEARFGSAVS